MKNYLINGEPKIWQRNTVFSPAQHTKFAADRWSFWNSTAGVFSISRDADIPTPQEAGYTFDCSMKISVLTPDTSISPTDWALFLNPIEGYDARHLIGQVVTLSFWVKAYKSGIYCCFFSNGLTDRSYVAEYTINASNTWEKKIITLTVDDATSGTWDFTNDVGLFVGFTLAAGLDHQYVANTWNSGNMLATVNQVNGCDSTLNDFWITGIQFEKGNVATEFEHRSFAEELALCQRYYQKSFDYDVPVGNGRGTLNGAVSYLVHNAGSNYDGVHVTLPVQMRGVPVVTTFNPFGDNSQWRNTITGYNGGIPTVNQCGNRGFTLINTQDSHDLIGQLIAVHYEAYSEIGS